MFRIKAALPSPFSECTCLELRSLEFWGFFKSFYHIVSLPFSFSLFLECFLALPPDSDHLKLFVSLKRIVLENKKKCCAVGFQEHDGGKHVIFLAWCVRAGKIFFFLVRWLYFCFHPPPVHFVER